MGSIINILKGPVGRREIEGAAEIVKMIDYGGEGWYLFECVFCDDPEKKVCRREWNIDEQGSHIGQEVDNKATPPLPVVEWWVVRPAPRTQKGRTQT
jgi:hypothetical protein